jgi:hypothetical protein
MTDYAYREHCAACAAAAVALNDAGLPLSARAAIRDCAPLNRPVIALAAEHLERPCRRALMEEL